MTLPYGTPSGVKVRARVRFKLRQSTRGVSGEHNPISKTTTNRENG
jgi:hypothetical protein